MLNVKCQNLKRKIKLIIHPCFCQIGKLKLKLMIKEKPLGKIRKHYCTYGTIGVTSLLQQMLLNCLSEIWKENISVHQIFKDYVQQKQVEGLTDLPLSTSDTADLREHTDDSSWPHFEIWVFQNETAPGEVLTREFLMISFWNAHICGSTTLQCLVSNINSVMLSHHSCPEHKVLQLPQGSSSAVPRVSISFLTWIQQH